MTSDDLRDEQRKIESGRDSEYYQHRMTWALYEIAVQLAFMNEGNGNTPE